MKNKNEYIWYLCYGSNLSKKRFLCYIQGGQPIGSNKSYEGCQNKALPVKEMPVELNYELYFALCSKTWQDGGIGFIKADLNENQRTKAYLYLITKEQFLEVVQQEIGSKKQVEIDFKNITEGNPYVFKEGVKYGKIIYFGEEDSYPVYSFTHSQDLTVYSKPSPEYLKTIISGLAESHKISRQDVLDYLKEKNGIINNYSEEELKKLIDQCATSFQEFSKEFSLPRKKVDFTKLTNDIQKLKDNNADITFQIHEVISDELIEEYVRFSRIADQNTKGLLNEGEQSKISIESIKNGYNSRGSDKLYFDILAVDSQNKIIGKLNSWGFKAGGALRIFHLYVDIDYRKKGIGKVLLLETLKYANDNLKDLTNFELQTHLSNNGTQKIISELGFELQKEE